MSSSPRYRTWRWSIRTPALPHRSHAQNTTRTFAFIYPIDHLAFPARMQGPRMTRGAPLTCPSLDLAVQGQVQPVQSVMSRTRLGSAWRPVRHQFTGPRERSRMHPRVRIDEGDRGTCAHGAVLTGLDLCEVELPNTLRCTGHVHAVMPRYCPHAGIGLLRPSVAPREDYAAPQTSQTPTACRCRSTDRRGERALRPSPGASLEGTGRVRSCSTQTPTSRPLPGLRRVTSLPEVGRRCRDPAPPSPLPDGPPNRASCPFRRSPSTVTTEENGH